MGGGPTGVELARSIAGLARELSHEFRRADPAAARVILLEAGTRLLGGFSSHLGLYALRELKRLHVEVRLSSHVDAVSARGVATSAGPLEASLVVWCAGVRGSAPGRFVFYNPGALAVIGGASAIADFGRLRLTGFPAWVIWACAHIFFLIGFRNRTAVFLTWAWEWLTRSRTARLIVDRPIGYEELRTEQQSRASAGR